MSLIKKIDKSILNFCKKVAEHDYGVVGKYARSFFKMLNSKSKSLFDELRDIAKQALFDDHDVSQAEEELKDQIRRPVKFVLGVIGAAAFIFIIWGSFAPLDSASIAPGHIVLSGNHKTIQHQEGGIIDAIYVEDGSFVKQGKIMLKLNATSAKARAQMILSQLRTEKAALVRLEAERDDKHLLFNDPIFDTGNVEVTAIIRTQRDLFGSRKQTIKGELEVIKQRVLQYNELIKGLQAQEHSIEAQLKLVAEELVNLDSLYKKKLILQSRIIDIRRLEQDLEGRLGDIKANIAKSKEGVAEAELQQVNILTEFRRQVSIELRDVQSKVADLQEQYSASLDVLDRIDVKATADGVVTGMQYHNVGGVIAPGSRILDIVPQDDKLIIEARVSVRDIESIRPGLKAKIQLSAYKSRLVPRLNGIVRYVSADRIVDPQSPMMPYYLAKIEIDEEELKQVNYDIKLYPGMPADVFIVKGERTFLQYILSPIIESFHKSFKEA